MFVLFKWCQMQIFLTVVLDTKQAVFVFSAVHMDCKMQQQYIIYCTLPFSCNISFVLYYATSCCRSCSVSRKDSSRRSWTIGSRPWTRLTWYGACSSGVLPAAPAQIKDGQSLPNRQITLIFITVIIKVV